MFEISIARLNCRAGCATENITLRFQKKYFVQNMSNLGRSLRKTFKGVKKFETKKVIYST